MLVVSIVQQQPPSPTIAFVPACGSGLMVAAVAPVPQRHGDVIGRRGSHVQICCRWCINKKQWHMWVNPNPAIIMTQCCCTLQQLTNIHCTCGRL